MTSITVGLSFGLVSHLLVCCFRVRQPGIRSPLCCTGRLFGPRCHCFHGAIGCVRSVPDTRKIAGDPFRIKSHSRI
ncbi:hypothetical protein IWX49DRAFT_560448 [Phyllosticta citricarpa]